MRALATRMQSVQSPIIPVIGELIQANPGTISLGQGVVSYGPPQQAIAQISQFLAQPQLNRYQAVEGIPELRQAIQTKLMQDNQMKLGSEREIVITAGANMAFLQAILAITQAGDEIILPTPYYFNQEMAIAIANCRAVLVPTNEKFQLQPEAITQAITPRTRAVVTISPNNPTGVVYPAADLKAVNQLCREAGIYHISDEAYEYFTYEGTTHFSPGAIPGSEDHTISLYSLSKAYGFASWRIGYMVIPRALLEAVKKIQDTNLICPPVISQYAALGALQTGKAYCQKHLPALAQVRQTALQAMETLGAKCAITPARGAFYAFLKLECDWDALELARQLIERYQVAVIPGTTFGMDEACYLRVAYGALAPETVAMGVERLVKGLKILV